MVGLAGLEPATSRPPDGRATRLRYSPTWGPSDRFTQRGQEGSAILFHLTQGALAQATEGSNQAEASEANGLLAQAVTAIAEAQQTVSAAIRAFEGVANRL